MQGRNRDERSHGERAAPRAQRILPSLLCSIIRHEALKHEVQMSMYLADICEAGLLASLF